MLDKFKYVAIGLILGIGSTFGFSHAQEWLNVSKVNYAINVNLEPAKMGDTAILNYNGSTYLPIRKVSEITGLKIEWHEKEKMVNIVTPSPKIVEVSREVIKEVPKEVIKEVQKEVIKEVIKEVPKIEYVENNEKIQEIKDIIYIMHLYTFFNNVNSRLNTSIDLTDVFFNSIFSNKNENTQSLMSSIDESLNSVNKDYNNLLNYYNITCVPIANKRGYDLSVLKSNIDSFKESYNYSQNAFKDAEMYLKYKLNKDEYSYFKNFDMAKTIVIKAFSQSKYNDYLNKALAIK
jgi:hypothetical protein